MMANVTTGIRILVSVDLLFCPVFSLIFYAVYLIAGLSDMADGIVARKTNSVSEFGSRFDSIADFVFVAVCLIKILPAIDIPIWLYVWTAVIFFVKIINIISGYAIGTKSQQALKLQQEQNKQERKVRSREQREAESQRLFELKQMKKREKHKGH